MFRRHNTRPSLSRSNECCSCSSNLWEHNDVHCVEVHEANEKATTDFSEANAHIEWSVEYESLRFQLHITPFGHVGLFPEHAAHWPWIDEQARRTRTSAMNSFRDETANPKCRVLNLFAYTGAASLYAAAHDCEVVHVDASSPAVQWARTNAKLSRLENAPIRWIVDDARTFVARELRRKRQYEMILLDPPTYGHGPKGNTWQIERHLSQLLNDCVSLLTPDSQSSLLITGHSPGEADEWIQVELLARQSSRTLRHYESGRTTLKDSTGRTLDCGWYARCSF